MSFAVFLAEAPFIIGSECQVVISCAVKYKQVAMHPEGAMLCSFINRYSASLKAKNTKKTSSMGSIWYCIFPWCARGVISNLEKGQWGEANECFNTLGQLMSDAMPVTFASVTVYSSCSPEN